MHIGDEPHIQSPHSGGRSSPKKNDQASIESKNNHLVWGYGFYHRYDTALELELLNRLRPLVCDRLKFFTPTKKPIGNATDSIGRRKRLNDKSKAPYQRLLEAEVLSSPNERSWLAAYQASLRPAAMAQQIHQIQQELTRLGSCQSGVLTSGAWSANAPTPISN